MKAIIYCVVFLTFLAVGVTSLKCIVCDSIKNGEDKCWHGEKYDKAFGEKECNVAMQGLVPDANQNYTICRKIVTVIDFDVNSNKKGERINRVCGWETSKYDNECYYRGGLGGRTTVCSCTDKNNCNGASVTGAAVTSLVLPSIYLLAKFISS